MAENFENDPLWYKDAIIYELHVKSFYDSNNDGIGDFQGLIQKLDYLESIGITAVWLLPFYPSPLKDDGYDIADYTDIHPDYGTLRDFRDFLKAAHARGIRVITELVINHTSDQHAWFQRARSAEPDTVHRNYYVWNSTPDKYKDARIIFTDFENSNWTYDSQASAYFWHRFYSHQPDLNFDNPSVHRELFKVLEFWFDMGVDGMRLDAIPYLYERQNTNCENLPETYAFLRKLRSHVEAKYKGKLLLAEANQWPQDAVAYFGKGDMCNMAFHFPLMPRLFMALQMEDRFPIVDILEETPAIPPACQWGLFLRNHDELTLEMVTDEERDYMYRIYALDPRAKINLGIRRRLAPLLDNNRRKMELMAGMLFSLPGTPIIYYGDEIGMGDNYYLGDRNGVRTPMQWSPDRNAGFSKVNPQRLNMPVIIDPEYHYEAINVETQDHNVSSLLWWHRRLLAIRKRFKAFGRGDFHFIPTENPKIFAFTRTFDEQTIFCIFNLSRFAQVASFDLSAFNESIPREIFSQNPFPQIRSGIPYTLTLGPHGFYWFDLKTAKRMPAGKTIFEQVAPIHVEMNWQSCLCGKYANILEDRILPPYLMRCRWFGSKARNIIRTKIKEAIPFIAESELLAYLIILEVVYNEGMPQQYFIPIAHSPKDKVKPMLDESPQAFIAPIFVDQQEGVLYDAVFNKRFCDALLPTIANRKRIRGNVGQLSGVPAKDLRTRLYDLGQTDLASHLVKAQQSNTGVIYGKEFILKFYRSLDDGLNPEIELQSYLTEKAAYRNIPKFYGSIEYNQPSKPPITLGILQAFVPNEGDGWAFALSSLGQYFEAVLAKHTDSSGFDRPVSLCDIKGESIPKPLEDLVGHLFLQMISVLGTRTAQMHLALASEKTDPALKPEPFTTFYQNSIYQGARSDARRALRILKSRINSLGPDVVNLANRVLELEPKIIEQYQMVRQSKIDALKIRIHGDFHLGQVLYTGKDFMMIDFEGEPARPLSERRLKRSCFRDLAGMIRSFHYAAHGAILRHGLVRPEDVPILEPWADLWYHCVAQTFMSAYLKTVADSPIIPVEKQYQTTLLHTFLLQKALYELSYELNNRPDWVIIPIKGIIHIVEGHSDAHERSREK